MKSLLALLALLNAWTLCLAGTVTRYTVVVRPSRPDAIVAVAVGQDVYPLQPMDTMPFLYTGNAPNQSPYRYMLLAPDNTVIEHEPFERPAINEAASTFNEVYGRPWNKLELPSLPKIFDFQYDTKRADPGESGLYEDGVIAQLFFEGPQEALAAIHQNKMDTALKVPGSLTYVSYNHLEKFNDVQLKIAGHNTKAWAKVPYKIKIPQATYPNGLFRRWQLKLRPEATDTTMVREKVYSDILTAAGILGPRSGYARLYFNGEPIGLYLLTDDVGHPSFYHETFHDGDAAVAPGVAIKADGGRGAYPADMDYHGDNPTDYDPSVYRSNVDVSANVGQQQTAANSTSHMKEFIELLKYVKEYNPDENGAKSKAVEEWNKHVDVDHLVRQLAIEWLAGNWDGVQYAGNNYMVYFHPIARKHVFIPMDFDSSFGNGIKEDKDKLIGAKWTDFTSGRRVYNHLWLKMASVPKIQKMYMDAIYAMNEQLTKPDILMPRIEALAYMIQGDVEWDKQLTPFTEGRVRPWAGTSYMDTLELGSGEPDEPFSLKTWVREKYQAIHIDYVKLSMLDKDDLKALIESNAIDMRGVQQAQQVDLPQPPKILKKEDM
ncbi:coth protein-domain-containing protein [Gongronella butleri]|nr:coth protein-domain-containing protein [Gongronella butleri]